MYTLKLKNMDLNFLPGMPFLGFLSGSSPDPKRSHYLLVDK